MNNDQLWYSLNELSIICGMNQRYAQEMATSAAWWSSFIDAAVVVATMVTFALGVAAYLAPNGQFIPKIGKWGSVDFVGMISSAIAGVVGLVLVVNPATDNVQHYNAMFNSWSDLRRDVDSAIVDIDGNRRKEDAEANAYGERRYRDLLAKKNELNSREPSPNQKRLDELLAIEEISRGVEQVKTPQRTSPEAPSTSAAMSALHRIH